MPCIWPNISRGTSYRKPRLFNDGGIPTAEYNPSIRQALMLPKLLVRHDMNRFCVPSEIGILFQPRSIHDAFDLIRLVALIDWNNSPCSCPSQHLFSLLGKWPCQIHEEEMNQWSDDVPNESEELCTLYWSLSKVGNSRGTHLVAIPPNNSTRATRTDFTHSAVSRTVQPQTRFASGLSESAYLNSCVTNGTTRRQPLSFSVQR